jgi:hypothetical protein
MATRTQEFQTIRSEGGLLPPDLLRRVIDPRGSLKGTKPEDYGLPQGERLNEVITQAWNRLRRHWNEFRAAAGKLPEGEAGTGLTNDKWSLPLLRELGYGLLPAGASPEIAGRTYAISRFFGCVPIHLVGCGLSLDRRAAGVRGAAGGNPHGLVQEVLNRSPNNLWGIVGNGLRLRILRDNQALSRQSFLEFDLEAMLSAEAYSDFVLLWLVAHATRLAPRDSNLIESCWLEEWTKDAQEQGTRALKDLRGSVERALEVLGEGFTSHPKNTALREALRSSSVPLTDFHGQLLRVVYRLIFLFVAEDRTLEGQSLLHPRGDSEDARVARERYAAHYGTVRLRELAGKIKGSRHGDLWRQFQILVGALSGELALEGTRHALALPALGSFLWSQSSTDSLNDAELTNHDFLEALRHLAFTRQGKVLRPVDYRNLGAEELGGVYESLLALTPQISADGARFTFAEFAGNERKTSGSYYTPDSLVQCLLDSALDPVVEDAIKGKTGAGADQAILGLKVCDPAVGSGHFLVGAAHRLARHLSRVRAQTQGESEPSPLLYQHALRDVIGRCLYGVDVNPMAAELCRVSLWLEALEPGKPLSFLDHHIRVGNSLLGTTPALIAGGLPDEAFSPIEGDDKKACAELRKRSRAEGKGLGSLFVSEDTARDEALRSAAMAVDEMDDDTPERLARKAESFVETQKRYDYVAAKRLADAWCTAFVIRKHYPPLAHAPRFPETKAFGITQGHLVDLAQGRELPPDLAADVDRLVRRYQFFHWQLAFPEVFARGGFDCVLGNPPWEKIHLRDEEFFATRHPEIAQATTKAQRKRLIETLKSTDSSLFAEYEDERDKHERISAYFRGSGYFPMTGVSRINLYSVFCETAVRLVSKEGRVGLALASGLLTDDNNKELLAHLVKGHQIVSAWDFENSMAIFPEVHRSYKFALITLAGSAARIPRADFAFYLRGVEDLSDPRRHFSLSSDDLALLNPNTRACPAFRSDRDALLALAAYRRTPPACVDMPDQTGWPGTIKTPFNSANDSIHFKRLDDLLESGARCEAFGTVRDEGGVWLPVYEPKFIHQFDHRFATRSVADLGEGVLDVDLRAHSDPKFSITPRHYLNQILLQTRYPGRWHLVLRNITGAVNERTSIAALIPERPCVDANLITDLTAASAMLVCANMNSFVYDYFARQKIAGVHFNQFMWKQLPLISPKRTRQVDWTSCPDTWLLQRALELTYTGWDIERLSVDLGYDGPPFRWDEERRFLIRCELDAAFFHLYLRSDAQGHWRQARKADGSPNDETPEEFAELKMYFPTPRDAVADIMDSFPIVRRNDEEAYNGDYRTKRVILDMYDEMQRATSPGQSYQTRVNPPPGPPTGVDGNFVSYAQNASSPPPHIHLPSEAVAGGSVALQLSDLVSQLPTVPFLLRLGTSDNAKAVRVRPVRTEDVQASDCVVLASAKLRSVSNPFPAVIGRLRVEARTDATDGSAYVLVTVRGDDGTAQARFSEEEWRSLTTIGVVDDSDGS